MTRDEILAMQAGREMDALVAVKVMGWELQQRFHSLGGYTVVVDGAGTDRFMWHNLPDVSSGQKRWSPSADLSAAWEVVEKMQSSPMEWYFWHCQFFGRMGYADTAPLAICKAALLAVLE